MDIFLRAWSAGGAYTQEPKRERHAVEASSHNGYGVEVRKPGTSALNTPARMKSFSNGFRAKFVHDFDFKKASIKAIIFKFSVIPNPGGLVRVQVGAIQEVQ